MATKRKPVIKKPTGASVDKFTKGSKSGQVPEGCVRFSVNLQVGLHTKLRRAAGKRTAKTGKQVTMGDLVKELIKKHL